MTAQELLKLARDGKFSEWLDQYIIENRKFLESIGHL
jgi:hypothetical protein